jgi:aspartate aminotransferase-like enzyme
MAQLRVPGPTPCPPEVLKAGAWQMINHRGSEFHEMITQVTEDMKKVYQTKNDVLLLTGSGTGGLESAVVNLFSPGDKVLSVSIGVFGDRWSSIAKTFGVDIISLKAEWGKAADPDALKKALKDNPGVKAVFITHNETSTGVTNDLKSLAKVVKDAGKLLVVDAISSLSSVPLLTDEWNCDVVISGSQKGWMVPPGMAFASVSPEAWKFQTAAKIPHFYWDYARAKKNYDEKKENPWTPAVSIINQLSVSLKMIHKEGLDNVFARHAKVAQMTRDGAKKMGLTLFADPKYASNTVTAINTPEGLDGKKLRTIMREEFGVVISGGQQTLDGKIVRVGHLGWINEKDVKEILTAMEKSLQKIGYKK